MAKFFKIPGAHNFVRVILRPESEKKMYEQILKLHESQSRSWGANAFCTKKKSTKHHYSDAKVRGVCGRDVVCITDVPNRRVALFLLYNKKYRKMIDVYPVSAAATDGSFFRLWKIY